MYWKYFSNWILMMFVLASAFPPYVLAETFQEQCGVLAGNPIDPKAGGIGVKLEDLDSAQALKVCHQALDQEPDSARLQFQLGRAYFKGEQFDAAQEWILKSASQGYVISQYSMGHFYWTGKGVKKDVTTGIKWIQKAADQGFFKAQNFLGGLYESGQGVEKNLTKAFHWYQQSAEQGNHIAQFKLGKMYANGNGVNKDKTKALSWYQKSAEQGFDKAQYSLGNMLDSMGVATEAPELLSDSDRMIKNDLKAIEWYRKAAVQGNLQALDFLGFKYRRGNGVEKNIPEAVHWYERAANLGSAKAQSRIIRNIWFYPYSLATLNK